jgi:hypothetical protein
LAGDSPFIAGMKSAQNQLIAMVSDLTPEQFSFRPPGTANPIAPTLHHIIAVHDRIANELILGRERQWVRGEWAAKLGLPSSFRLEPEHAEFGNFDFSAYRPYIDAVYEKAMAVLESLADEDFEREVQGFGGPVRLGTLVGRTMLVHFATHLGEIAAIKGVQGLKGLP